MRLPPLVDRSYARTVARLKARTSVEGDWNGTPHWVFTGVPNLNGYGQITHEGKGVYIHRVGQFAFRGPVPDGYEVDHMCRVKLCWNPDHTEPVTGAVNRQRAAPFRPPRQYAFQNECSHGHDLTAPDAVRPRARAGGEEYWACMACERSRDRPETQCHRDDVQNPRGPRPPKALCPKGHPMVEGNVYTHISTLGYACRTCRTCAVERRKAKR